MIEKCKCNSIDKYKISKEYLKLFDSRIIIRSITRAKIMKKESSEF
jgi:hypothetical protein